MKFKILLLLSVIFSTTTIYAQDVDELFKQALYETNTTKDYPKAMQLAKSALSRSPDYVDVRLLVARLYRLTDQPDSARQVYKGILSIAPANADAVKSIKNLDIAQEEQRIASLPNRVSVTYNPTFFERAGKRSWNLVNVYYGRQTKYGSIIGRISYADRSYDDGLQYELEAYPKHKNGYSFVNFAYSNATIFQKYRAAYSYLHSFNGGWEGELGVRYQYKNQGLFSYGGSVGKYLGSYWFNLRTYITPDSGRVSQSYALTGRYYVGTADDYFTAIVGTGISPDDRTRNFELSERLNTSSLRLSLGYQRLIWSRNVVGILGTYNREEYVAGRKENEYDISINFQHRF
ncbi:MAG: YaiO family outer membrane beta-barrel protein [Bacteroidota bacterium]